MLGSAHVHRFSGSRHSLYACSAAVAPVAFAFVDKGIPLVLLWHSLWLLRIIIARNGNVKKVLSLRLILIFAFILTMGIIITGYLFNMIL
jgi:uncharacterized membrane protein YraQ (UPF0718 family)